MNRMTEMNLEGIANVKIVSPSEQQFNVQAEKQKREMGATVDQVFSPQNMGEAVRRLHQKRQEEQRRMSRTNWERASIINLMPFPLNVSGVLHARLAGQDGNQVPACKLGEPYEHFVIKDLHWAIRDEGAGMDNVDNYTPVAIVPMELADDYSREFLDRMGVGGVIVYEGDEKPESKGLKKELEEARRTRNQWLLRKVHEAEADWADTSGRGRKNITDLHRKAAEVLLHDKVLKHQPAWLLALNGDGGELPDPCVGCGEVADPKASICKGCGYVFKPVTAFKAALIEYDHTAMQRLTKEEWEEVNAIQKQREMARAAAKK
jgi:hypothetical protein